MSKTSFFFRVHLKNADAASVPFKVIEWYYNRNKRSNYFLSNLTITHVENNLFHGSYTSKHKNPLIQEIDTRVFIGDIGDTFTNDYPVVGTKVEWL